MLTQLYIQNIAVIEQASIDFEPGFTVLTGETGAAETQIFDEIDTGISCLLYTSDAADE